MHARHSNCRNVVRVVSLVAFLLTVSMVANAYIVVMRGGKRIEIPSHFTVTNSTLTYEVSPGVQITLATAAIDIAATEVANKELPGSFLRRIHPVLGDSNARAEVKVSPRPANTSARTINNRDLESTAQRRRASESAYENRRKQLGLPSVDESRRQAAEESALIMIQLEQARAADKESESYWRGRASALRTETAALDAELNYIRSQLDETAFANLGGSFTTVTSGVPFGLFGSFGSFRSHEQFGRVGFGPPNRRPLVFGPPRHDPQPTGQVGFGGGATRGRVFINPLGFRRSHPVSSPLFGSNIAIFGSTSAYDTSFERNWLITRFNELAATRAGLNARWRELEDEARRAGAPPGWLRP
jgi:hypothetical protein